MWQIPFKSFKTGTDYTVNIYGGTGTVVLKGGAHPFVTQEDADDDMFTPIRTQTGNITIVDDGKDADGNNFDWTALIPINDTSRRVTLTHLENGSTVLDWQGYLQAQDFGSTLFEYAQERELPIQCPLAVLSTTDDFKPTASDGIKNFAYIIKTIFDKLTVSGTEITAYRFCGNNARTWLMKMVDLQNFITTDDTGNIDSRWDNMTIIEDICRFWGWTCRMQGAVVYFTANYDSANTQFLELTPTQMNTLATGASAGSYDDMPTASVQLATELCNNESERFYMHGYGKTLVTADANAANKNIIEFAPEVLEQQMAAITPYYNEAYGGRSNTYYTGDLMSFSTAFMSGTAAGTANDPYGSFNIGRNADANTEDVIRIRKEYTGADIIRMQTAFSHIFPGDGTARFGVIPKGFRLRGTIWQKGFVFTDYNETTGVGVKSMYCRLGIGEDRNSATWWNGAGWQSSPVVTKFWIGNREDIIYSCYGPDTSHLTGNTEVIPLPAAYTLHGKVFIEFLGSNDMPFVTTSTSSKIFDIVNFAIEYEFGDAGSTMLGVPQQDAVKKYKATANGMIKDEYGVDLIYASDNDMPLGYALVLNNDYTTLKTLQYGGQQKYQEQYLADIMASFWSQSRLRMSLDIWNRVITPLSEVTVSGTWHPISFGHDWRDEIMNMILIKL